MWRGRGRRKNGAERPRDSPRETSARGAVGRRGQETQLAVSKQTACREGKAEGRRVAPAAAVRAREGRARTLPVHRCPPIHSAQRGRRAAKLQAAPPSRRRAERKKTFFFVRRPGVKKSVFRVSDRVRSSPRLRSESRAQRVSAAARAPGATVHRDRHRKGRPIKPTRSVSRQDGQPTKRPVDQSIPPN